MIEKKCQFDGCRERGVVEQSDQVYTCPLHFDGMRAMLTLSSYGRRQLADAAFNLTTGKFEIVADGITRQVPPKPAPPHIIREDDGSVRTSMVKWYTEDQRNAALGIDPIVVERMPDWKVPEGFAPPDVEPDVELEPDEASDG